MKESWSHDQRTEGISSYKKIGKRPKGKEYKLPERNDEKKKKRTKDGKRSRMVIKVWL